MINMFFNTSKKQTIKIKMTKNYHYLRYLIFNHLLINLILHYLITYLEMDMSMKKTTDFTWNP